MSKRASGPDGTGRLLRFSIRDWLALLGFWLLGCGVSVLLLYPLMRIWLQAALVGSVTDRITSSVLLTEALLEERPTSQMPAGLQLARQGADQLPLRSGDLRSGFDHLVQQDLRRHHNLDRRLRRVNPQLPESFSGYWVELKPTGVPRQWLLVPSGTSSLGYFWPLVRTLSVMAGALFGLIAFLRFRVEGPLHQLLSSMPPPSANDERLPLVAETGVSPMQELARRINRLVETHNSRAAERFHLLRGLAHDIRSPLTRLMLRREQLAAAPSPELVDALLPPINSDLDHLAMLADQLSALASQEDPGQERRSFNLASTCCRVAQSYGGGLVQVRVPQGLLVVLNQELLQRSLINLIDNGLDYGEAPVVISAQRRSAQGLWIQVDDHGHGLGDYGEQGARPLQRADDRQRHHHRGLGLAIVRRFCRDHGGELVLTKAPCGGLRARLQLPAAVLV